jgi:hypothetical protein
MAIVTLQPCHKVAYLQYMLYILLITNFICIKHRTYNPSNVPVQVHPVTPSIYTLQRILLHRGSLTSPTVAIHGRLQEPTSEPAYKKKRNMARILLYGRNENTGWMKANY